MAVSCETHTAYVYDRGGKVRLGALERPIRVQWNRERDETSTAEVKIRQNDSTECDRTIGLLASGRHELVIYRGQARVWEGPITRLEYRRGEATVYARDVSHYLNRMIMRFEYDNRYPNMSTTVRRMERIIRAEAVRFEALVPGINLVPHLQVHAIDEGEHKDAGTTSHTLPYQFLVMEHLENLAARAGLDYTVVGRSVHLWDVHNPAMGRTNIVTEDDFVGEVVITEYGMELATYAAMTDGRGRYGAYGGHDPFYGLVEILETAYDEATGDDWDDVPGGGEPPSEAEMRSQAQRVLSGSNPAPIVVRVPDNSTLNPKGTLSIGELVPGVFIPLQADLPGRTLSQIQKLDSLRVEETGDEGETISVTLSPAPMSLQNFEREFRE